MLECCYHEVHTNLILRANHIAWVSSLVVVQDAVPEDKMKEEMMDSIQKGNFTMRILKDQLQNILKMGPMGQVMGMIPGFGNSMMPKVCHLMAHTSQSF